IEWVNHSQISPQMGLRVTIQRVGQSFSDLINDGTPCNQTESGTIPTRLNLSQSDKRDPQCRWLSVATTIMLNHSNHCHNPRNLGHRLASSTATILWPSEGVTIVRVNLPPVTDALLTHDWQVKFPLIITSNVLYQTMGLSPLPCCGVNQTSSTDDD
ncbi:hypothetical protein RRG08_064098, partial [Elysia crispata]